MKTNATTQTTDVREIPISQINSPKHNPREDFDEQGLKDLAASIEEAGLLQPVIVRPKGDRFELVAGERRLRSARLLGWTRIPASIRELDDRQAAEIRLLENLDRADLNPLEEAHALRQLQDLGHGLQSMAKLIHRTEAAIKGRIALLQLPDEWQDRVKANRISAAAAEYLVPTWISYPDVLDHMKGQLDNWPMPLCDWRRRLIDCVLALSRSMDVDAPDGPQFEPAPEDLERLDVVEFEAAPGKRMRRAMSVGVWDVLQDEAALKAEQETAAAMTGTSSRDRAAGNGDGRGDESDSADDSPDEIAELWAQLAVFKRCWLERLLHDHIAALDLAELEALVGDLVNLDDEWKLDRDFLELHSGQQLLDLAADLDVDVSACRGDTEVIAVLLHAGPTKIPTEFFDLNEVLESAAGEVAEAALQ